MKLITLAEELLLELSPEEIHSRYYTDIKPAIFRQIVRSDPQSKSDQQTGQVLRIGKYSKILLNLFMKGQLKLEDLSKVYEYLTYVYKHQVPLDINKISDISDIYNLVKKYIETDVQDLSGVMKSLSPEDYKVLMDGKEWHILQPLTEKGACYLGINTQWCTSWGPYSLNKSHQERKNYFNNHHNRGILYIIINKINTEEKYQFHFESEQFMNASDRRINTGEFFDRSDEVRNFFFPSFVRKVSPEQENLEAKRINLLSGSDAMTLLKKILSNETVKNPIVDAIVNVSEEKLNKLIIDDSISEVRSRTFIELSVEGLTFDIEGKYYTDNLNMIQDSISSLQRDIDDASNRVYEDIYSGGWNDDELEVFFKNYFDENVHKEDTIPFLVAGYEQFKLNYFEMFFESDTIREEFIDGVVNASVGSYEDNLRNMLRDITQYISVDYYDHIILNNINFSKFLLENNIVKIENNFLDVLDTYIDSVGLDQDGMYEGYLDYGIDYPAYEDMRDKIESFFDDLYDDYENTQQCVKYRLAFNEILEKQFKNNYRYENDHVLIVLRSTDIDCENGTVNIYYKNKDNGKDIVGPVKIENIPTYMTNYSLFELYMRYKSVIG